MKTLMLKIRKYLIAGLLVWVPILVTIWVIKFFISLLDGSLKLLPKAYQPAAFFGFDLPGLGVLLCLVILFFTGMFATNFLGQYLMRFWDYIIGRIPLVRTIYAGVKQIMETLFHSGSQAFRKVILVEYPRKGLWSIAFQTAHACKEINAETGEKMLAVFVPTTPNPTSGFLIFVPAKDIQQLNINVDVALKMVISLGVVQPSMSKEQVDKLLHASMPEDEK